MSVAVRLISGSAASWTRIGVTMVSQIALVPLFLNHWSVETYGVWLALHALEAVIVTLDLGHQTYLGYEFLRMARNDIPALSRNLWSGVGIGFLLSILQVVFILLIIYTGLLPLLLGNSNGVPDELVNDAGVLFILLGLVWLIASSARGLIVRALEPFGYYPRLTWWNTCLLTVMNVCPAVAVVFGADLLTAGIVHSLAVILCSVPIYLDVFSLLKKENVQFTRPSLKLGIHNFLRSTGVSGKLILENARQQGVRILLAPLSGMKGLAAFATMRTGSNVALQGLNTITNPLMPDLMRFLHDRDQVRSEAAFGTVWIVVVALMSPTVIILQAFMEPIFSLWTQGQIEFDPLLFAILSLSVLVYAVAQPAIAVVVGNNLIRTQLLLSVLAAMSLIGGIFLLVPWIGISGAGIALLVAEVVAIIGYTIIARQWLLKNSMVWPGGLFLVTLTSVCFAAIAMGAMVILPHAKWLVLGIALIFLAWNIKRCWQLLPSVFTNRARHIFRTLPVIRIFFSF